MSSTLYVVATPIGNLQDITHRAQSVLDAVDVVAAEDTRRTRVLLNTINAQPDRLISLHAHNEDNATRQVLGMLQSGLDVALVSDAGTPMINDPGFQLVQACRDAQLTVVPVPGCSSIVAALSVCPLPCQQFSYLGFLPVKSAAREGTLQTALAQGVALVILEAPHRILATLDMLAVLSSRPVFVARELTKKHETLYCGSAAEVRDQLGGEPKGEIVLIIGGDSTSSVSLEERQVMTALLSELPPAQAARLASKFLPSKRGELYNMAMDLGRSG